MKFEALRGSIYNNVLFVRTILWGVDLRRSTFNDCSFTDADMLGAKLTHAQGKNLKLSEKQCADIEWQESNGELPPGG